jgi:hypothetical protein
MAGTPKLSGFKGFESSGKIVSPHLRVNLSFFPQDRDPIFDRKNRTYFVSADPQKSLATLVDFSWSKQIGQPSAQWTATIKETSPKEMNIGGGDLMDGDWVLIEVVRNGVVFPLGLGVVDSIRINKRSSQGATVKTFSVAGRDHGALFEVQTAWSNLHIQSVGQLVKGFWTEAVKGSVGGKPSVMFETLINATFQSGVAGTRNQSGWALPTQIFSLLGYDNFAEALSIKNDSPTRGMYFNELQLWTQVGQTLWGLFQEWCNPLLNEYFVDFDNISSGDEEMEAVIRERPFINSTDMFDSPWFKLKRHTLPHWLIETYDVGRGGHDRFNIFEIVATYGLDNTSEQSALISPMFNAESISTHGIRPFQQETKYISSGGQGDWIEEVKGWMALLVDWYGPNPYFLNGSVGIGTMFPEIKIGQRLRIDVGEERSSETYYVEGLTHQWRFGPTGARGQSTFNVTRGIIGDDGDAVQMIRDVSNKFTEAY